MKAIDAPLDGKGKRFAIVVARFNATITERLLESARATFESHGVASNDLFVARVPGAFELPLAAQHLAETSRFAAVVALGAVVRGETPHFEHVCTAAARGILDAGLTTRVPVIFGVLTCDTVEQALARAGGARAPGAAGKQVDADRGASAARAALEMAALLAAIGKL